MRYEILHELPGRMRVRCCNLHLDPECRIELSRWIAQHPELQSARLSTRTGNLLILYDKNTDRETILLILADLQLFAVARFENCAEQHTQVTWEDAVARALRKEASHTVVRTLLPKPVQTAVSACMRAGGLCTVADKLSRGQIIEFLFLVAKMTVSGLFSTAFPGRILFTFAAALLEHIIFFPQWVEKSQTTAGTIVPFGVTQTAV